MKNTLIAAHTMAQAVQFDPQLALPRYPHFPRELSVIELDDGLLLDGTDELQILRGRATRVLLPRLLPLLDGTRTLQQIQQALPDIADQAILNAVALLYTRGVLEDAAVAAALPCSPNAQTLAFFRRYVDTTRVNRSANQAYQRLWSREVVVVTQGQHAEENAERLRVLLTRTGMEKLTVLPGGLKRLLYEQTDQYPGALLVVFLENEEDGLCLQQLDELCLRQQKAWLRAVWYAHNQLLEIGPYFEHGETLCYSCFRQTRESLGKVAGAHAPSLSALEEEVQRCQALSLLATEIVYFLSRIAPLATGSGVMRCNLADWTTERLRFPLIPGCPVCRPQQDLLADEIRERGPGDLPRALLYEDAVAFPSRHLLDPKTHQVHYRSDNIELTFQSKRYPGVLHISLTPFRDLPSLPKETLACLQKQDEDQAKDASGITLLQLTSILLSGAGVFETQSQTRTRVKRWSSTGGNLGSVEIYLVALHVRDLAPGLYFYQPFEHCLSPVALVNDMEQLRSFLDQALILATEPDALVITTSAFHRVSHKYGAFGYRICYLDAGFALGQMEMVGQSLGLETTILSAWADEVLAAHFSLQDFDEMVTAVMTLSAQKEPEGVWNGMERRTHGAI